MEQGDLRELLGLLRPHDVLHYGKIRQGDPHDGGYVLLDDFAGIATLVSCGIGGNVSFDSDVADRGIAVHQYDHTVERSPVDHAGFHFHRCKIGRQAGPDEASLGSIVQDLRLQDGLALLKIDIEGDEWEVFAEATAETLMPFRQIVGEFHWFEKAGDAQWLARAQNCIARLCESFAVVHVHANNYSSVVQLAGMAVPSVIELTFASRRWYQFTPSVDGFPTALDFPNNPERPDIPLGSFAF